MTMRLTEHFTMDELVHSQLADRLGLENIPPKDVAANLIELASELENVRSLLGHSILISSGYRSAKVNEALGGSATSAHMKGYAADFICPGFGSPFSVARAIAESDLKFDQLIREYGWVHISFDPKMRRQLLTKNSAGESYQIGIN